MRRLWLLCAVCLLLCSCGLSGEPSPETNETSPPDAGIEVLAIVDGVPILRSEFLYFLDMEMTGYENLQGGPIDWDSEEEGRPLRSYLKENTLSTLVMGRVVEAKAIELGLAATQEELEQIESYKRSEMDALGGREVFERQLASYGLTEEIYTRYIYLTPLLLDKLYNSLFGEQGSLRPDDDTTRAYFESSYARAAYLMVLAVGEEGYPLPESERAVPRATMAAYEEQLRQGTDIMALIDQNGEDFGMLEDPGDMYFSPGYMEPEFDDALFALEVGETSGVVETAFAFYIIRRLPLEERYLADNMESVRYACAESLYTGMLGEWTAGAELVRTEAYETLDPEQYYARG